MTLARAMVRWDSGKVMDPVTQPFREMLNTRVPERVFFPSPTSKYHLLLIVVVLAGISALTLTHKPTHMRSLRPPTATRSHASPAHVLARRSSRRRAARPLATCLGMAPPHSNAIGRHGRPSSPSTEWPLPVGDGLCSEEVSHPPLMN